MCRKCSEWRDHYLTYHKRHGEANRYFTDIEPGTIVVDEEAKEIFEYCWSSDGHRAQKQNKGIESPQKWLFRTATPEEGEKFHELKNNTRMSVKYATYGGYSWYFDHFGDEEA